MNLNDLKKLSLAELSGKAQELGILCDDSSKSEVLLNILREHTKSGGAVSSSGTLEILGDGFGFLRASKSDYSPSPEDIYVSPSQIRRFHLNTGDEVSGQVRPPKESERYFALLRVQTINGLSTDKAKTSQGFTERKAIRTTELLPMAPKGASKAAGLFGLLCPVGKGQRVLLFAPPRCQSRPLLLELGQGAQTANKDLSILTLLVCERPELIGEFQSAGVGEILASSYDEPVQRHAQVCDMALESAKRAAESGNDVLLLVSTLTSLASAASQCSPSTATNLPPGLSIKGLQGTKRILGAGRNLENGSITVIALLRDSMSDVDQCLRQELQPMANAEVQLSAKAASLGFPLPLRLASAVHEVSYNEDLDVLLTKVERTKWNAAWKSLTSQDGPAWPALTNLVDSL